MASSAHEGSRVLTQLGREQMRGGGTKQNTGGTPGKVDSLNPGKFEALGRHWYSLASSVLDANLVCFYSSSALPLEILA